MIYRSNTIKQLLMIKVLYLIKVTFTIFLVKTLNISQENDFRQE